MQTGVVKISLAGVIAPATETKQKSKGWVEYGAKHSYWGELLKVKKASTTQSSVSRTKAAMIRGNGFSYDVKNKALHEFMKAINANKILKAVARDVENMDGYALQVIWNEDGTSIAEIHYEPMRRVAFGLRDDEEEITEYWLSKDWGNTGKAENRPERIAAFNPETARQDKRQLYVRMTPSETNDYYAEPDYASALYYLQLEAELAKYHLKNVQGNFSASNVIFVPDYPEVSDGQSLEEACDAHTKKLEKRLTGPEGQRVLVIYGVSGGENTAKVEPLTPAQNAEIYSTYSSLCVEKILAANRVTSPVIVGLPGGPSLSGDGTTIREAFELFQSVVIRPAQVEIIEGVLELLEHVKGITLKGTPDKPDLDIVTPLPVKNTFSEETLEQILDPDEMRAMIDYAPREHGSEGDEENPMEGTQPPAGGNTQPDANATAQAALRGSVGGITAIMDLMERVGKGVIDRQAALGILKNFYGLSPDQAEETLGTPKELPVGTQV